MTLPFALRRPLLLARGAFTNRDRPDLEALAAEADPERFVWRILPHAARTFSACIAMLPARVARAAAAGYLYCRILDTYEDLVRDPAARDDALRRFGARFVDGEAPAPAPPIRAAAVQDARDETHLLLVEKCGLVDAVYAELPADQRAAAADLVRAMAGGMRWSSETFRRQGGFLENEAQLLRYCRNVLGHPVVFTLRVLTERPLAADLVEDCMRVGEMVQLANVTRDIEKDLARGIGYDPRLREPARAREVRADLLRLAVRRAPAYTRMVDELAARPFARASAVLMLLFTERYYRSCAVRAGLASWPGPDSAAGLLAAMLPSLFSRAATRRITRQVERSLVGNTETRRRGDAE